MDVQYRSNSAMEHRREDIDILRAVAVLAVILFHLDIEWARAGFLGVDIFFVISGFLITDSIVAQSQTGRFSFLNFYARRMRRLLPALYVLLLFSSVGAIFFLPDSLLVDFKWSLASSASYLSNIYFFSQSGYFDLDASARPLLHTWSLSVEEQFYLFWPAFIVALLAGKLVIWLVAIGLASLISAQIIGSSFPDAVFYLFPFRIFEFVAGALCVFSLTRPEKHKISFRLTCVTTFFVVIASMSLLSPENALPGLSVLPVVLGTALIIHLAPGMGCLPLGVRAPTLYIGRISYSMYLVHWPLITFYKFGTGWELEFSEIALLLLVTVLLGALLYHAVEYPFHYGKMALGRQMSVFLAPVGLVACLLITFLIPQFKALLPEHAEEIGRLIEPIRGFRKVAVLPITDATAHIRNPDSDKTILVIGDSLAGDLQHALWKNMDDSWNIKKISTACHPIYVNLESVTFESLYADFKDQVVVDEDRCRELHTNFVRIVKRKRPALIIFSEHWYVKALEHLPLTIEKLKEELGVPILLLGRNIELVETPQVFLARQDRIENINVSVTREQIANREGLSNAEYDRLMEKLADSENVFFVAKTQLVCPGPYCDIYYGGAITYVDTIHWSLHGMDVFGRRLVENETFQQFVSSRFRHVPRALSSAPLE